MIRSWFGRQISGFNGPLGAAVVVAAPWLGGDDCLAQCRYEVTLLPQIPSPVGPNGGEPRALNNAGQATGYYTTSIFNDFDKPFLWSATTGLQLINPPADSDGATGADISHPLPSDPRVWIVGENRGPEAYQPFLWRDEVFTVLPLIGPTNMGWATAVSDDGVVVGTMADVVTSNGYFAFRSHGNSVKFLPGRFDAYAEVDDISPDGRIIVGYTGPNGASVGARAFMHRDGVLTDLGVVPGGLSGRGRAVNNKGQIVTSGQYTPNLPSGFLSKLFLWQNDQFTELVNFTGFNHIVCGGINNRSEVVGDSFFLDFGQQAQRPWIWRGAELIDLNTLLIHGSGINPEAVGDLSAINDHGQILAQAGVGSPPHVSEVTVLLTPIPDRIGDTNCDGAVNVEDLLAVIGGWGPCPGQFCAADLDRNLTIDMHDILTVIEQWDLFPPRK